MSENYQNYIDRIVELKQQGKNTEIEIASTLVLAESELSKKEFRQFLKDNRVRYKLTQVKKYKKFDAGIKIGGHTSVQIKNLGVEKYYAISMVEDAETKEALINFASTDLSISVRILRKIVKLLNENKKITIEEAHEEAKNIKVARNKSNQNPDNFVSKEKFEELEMKYNDLLKEFEELKQQMPQNLNNVNVDKNDNRKGLLALLPKT